MPARWMAKATENAHGQFAAKAQKAHMTTSAFAHHVQANPKKFSPLTRKQASLALTLMKSNH